MLHGISPTPNRSTTSSNNWQRLPTISFLPQCKPLLKNLLRSESRAGRDSGRWFLPGCVFSASPRRSRIKDGGRSLFDCPRGSAISIRVVLGYSRKCDREANIASTSMLPRPWNALGSSIAAVPTLVPVTPHALTKLPCRPVVPRRGQTDAARLQGIALNGKTLTNLVYRFATRARQNLRRVHYRLPGQPTVKGMRLVVALDGGRARLRQNKLQANAARAGRHGYRNAPARRAQASLCIYAINTRTARSRKRSNRSSMGRSSYWRNQRKSSTG